MKNVRNDDDERSAGKTVSAGHMNARQPRASRQNCRKTRAAKMQKRYASHTSIIAVSLLSNDDQSVITPNSAFPIYHKNRFRISATYTYKVCSQLASTTDESFLLRAWTVLQSHIILDSGRCTSVSKFVQC